MSSTQYSYEYGVRRPRIHIVVAIHASPDRSWDPSIILALVWSSTVLTCLSALSRPQKRARFNKLPVLRVERWAPGAAPEACRRQSQGSKQHVVLGRRIWRNGRRLGKALLWFRWDQTSSITWQRR